MNRIEWEIMGRVFPERFRIFGWSPEWDFFKKCGSLPND